MDISAHLTDWSRIEAFLAVAETGSLSGAARHLNTSQPTLGRQIKQLEFELSVELFHRHPRGLELTQTGHSILPSARAMRDAMQEISLKAAGQQTDLAGDVRLTTSVFMAHVSIPPILAGLRRTHPDIRIDLLPSDDTENLLFREADIAVRMYRPEQLDMIAQHIGNLQLGIFAAKSYLAHAGRPTSPADLMNHDLIGYDRSDQIIRGMREMGFPVTRDWFKVRCDNQSAYWQLLRAGCGIGFSQIGPATEDPEVEQLFPDMPIPPLPVWLTAHEAMRQTPRIRVAWDALAQGLKPLVS